MVAPQSSSKYLHLNCLCICSFIAKNSTSSDSSERVGEESHECFVFISSKLASDITLTIGQAFELAYRYVLQ